MPPIENETLTLTKPGVDDGAAMWELVKDSTLDLNSPYKYLMMCKFFSETCVTAKVDDRLAGFITAFIPPEADDTVFVWQVGVDPSYRGRGIAGRMLSELMSRDICRQVRYLEATVTPTNEASDSLFKGYARRSGVHCDVKPCFPSRLFPGEGHEAELTYRIGPINEK
ncbi:diaminobutyrate acetyltransferase [Alteribacter natronophilus]|nr:diaminobutyrate acetyltransferase [Alteribacter natronophilus]